MQNKNIFFMAALIFTTICGFVLGYTQELKIEVIELSSQKQEQTITFAELPCPTEDEYQKLAKIIHLEIPKGDQLCDDSPRAKLGKILLFMSKIKLNMPSHWLPAFQKEFRDPLSYLALNSKVTTVDFENKNAYATNVNGSILIGGLLFNSNPIFVVTTLMHEARHSANYIVGHEICRSGDIPKTMGGCDDEFHIGKKSAGAYSFEVLFQVAYAMYGEGLRGADRDYLMSLALSTLSTRFNNVPAALAQKEDVLLALAQDGKIYSANPQKKAFQEISIRLPVPGDSVVKIDFSAKRSGAFLFTKFGHLYTWTFFNGLEPSSLSIPNTLAVQDAGMFVIPGENNRSRFGVLSRKGKVYVNNFNPALMKSQLELLQPKKQNETGPEFLRFFMASFGESVFLDKTGQLWLMTHDQTAEHLFVAPADLQDPRGWQYGTGGLNYEDLYLLNNAGDLKVATAQLTEIDDYNSQTTYTFEDHSFRISQRSIKYFQGIKIHALLNERGDVYVRSYGSDKDVLLSRPDLIDFTIIHNPRLSRKIIF